MSECENVTMRVRRKVIEKLKRLARQRSIDESDNITYSDLIRDAIEAKYGSEVKESKNG